MGASYHLGSFLSSSFSEEMTPELGLWHLSMDLLILSQLGSEEGSLELRPQQKPMKRVCMERAREGPLLLAWWAPSSGQLTLMGSPGG